MSTATLERVKAPISIPRKSVEDRAFSIPAEAHTLAGFREWILNAALPEECHVSYVSGEIFIDLSPERIGTHNAVKSEINYALVHLTRNSDRGKYFPDGVLVSNELAAVSNEPDAIYVLSSSLDSGKARLVPSADGKDFVEIEGTPDMVCEVLSPSSIRKDKVKLPDNYFRAGITEFWLVDALGNDLQFTIFHRARESFEASPVQDGWIESQVFERRFRLERYLDQFGTWVYRMHVEPLSPPTT